MKLLSTCLLMLSLVAVSVVPASADEAEECARPQELDRYHLLRRFSLDLFDALHRGDAAFHLANPTGALSTSFARAVRSAQPQQRTTTPRPLRRAANLL